VDVANRSKARSNDLACTQKARMPTRDTTATQQGDIDHYSSQATRNPS